MFPQLSEVLRAAYRAVRYHGPRAPLLAEAAATLVWARVLTRSQPFSNYKDLLNERGLSGSLELSRVREVAWAVDRLSRPASRTFSCLPQALAVQTMLRRRGAEGEIHFGVKKTGSGKIQAHAWVTWDGSPLIGNLPDLAEYAELPRWPGKI